MVTPKRNSAPRPSAACRRTDARVGGSTRWSSGYRTPPDHLLREGRLRLPHLAPVEPLGPDPPGPVLPDQGAKGLGLLVAEGQVQSPQGPPARVPAGLLAQLLAQPPVQGVAVPVEGGEGVVPPGGPGEDPEGGPGRGRGRGVPVGDDHRDAGPGEVVGDRAAHDPGADHQDPGPVPGAHLPGGGSRPATIGGRRVTGQDPGRRARNSPCRRGRSRSPTRGAAGSRAPRRRAGSAAGRRRSRARPRRS